MNTMQVNGADVGLNRQGYLTDFHSWSKEVAMVIAEEQGLELTACHWEVIEFLRGYYEEFETPPSPKQIIFACGKKITGSDKCKQKDLKALFPNGGCKQACKLAGLPRHYCHSC
ncbi:MAG TPA: sulfurtransferase TusE [Gammaproteobacteria bacterium]|nr:sulfurtransferase TusE [Gammaproteobacteria bacterium]